MTSTLDAIDRLRRRADHLAVRVERARAAGRDLTYDASELSALYEAIRALEERQKGSQA